MARPDREEGLQGRSVMEIEKRIAELRENICDYETLLSCPKPEDGRSAGAFL